ncbi:DUF1320 domain-containing protein [Endozoicomonas sp. SM1973]|uniref:DUF1320 domain-containing protein n=1 Tax=Spartinivicinus marinus TaxID=2994442 RepID=A0A853IG44_9GAMM|nr:DUF1320 domain-containing protein [Spartinivicinus marinus]
MVYAIEQAIIDRYGNDALYIVADRDKDDQLDHLAIEHALADASAHIDLYLTGRYTLPLSTPSALLTRLCVDIAIYWLGEDRGGASEERRKRFEDAEKTLAKIASGEVKLMIDAPTSNSTGISFSASKRQFSRQSLKGF